MTSTFEFLPNEILIEVFEYLNGFEIFDSFDTLNIRFDILIRSIPLHVNFQHVQKTIFDQFCTLIKSKPKIKNQIHSLSLSNKDTCGQIQLFVTLFSFNEFSSLRSLTLIHIEQNNIDKLKSMISCLFTLRSFRLIDTLCCTDEENEIITVLPILNLQRLSTPSIQSLQMNTNQNSIMTHLTIAGCTLDQLFYPLFKHLPLLKYLYVQNIYRSLQSIKTKECSTDCHAVHLTQMIIDNYQYLFEEFEVFVQLTPNLKRLTISALDNISMVDASRWEQLIESSLHFLTVFQFTFGLYCRRKLRNGIIEKFKKFQNDFWCKQRQWYIEYVLDTTSAVIYTIPYSSNTYRLTRYTEKYSNNPMNDFRILDNVTDLTLCCEAAVEKSFYRFSNVRSLTLESTTVDTKEDDHRILQIQHIKSLKTIVHFYNLTHLDIASYSTIETSSLLAIFTAAPQLSSVTIDPLILSIFLNENVLRPYLKKMIKKLSIHNYDHQSFKSSNDIIQFCDLFSSLKQLTCHMNQLDQFLLLLNQSAKLSSIKIFVSSENSEQLITWFINEARKFNIVHRISYMQGFTENGFADLYPVHINIWTSRSGK